jgi:hypothetical protein
MYELLIGNGPHEGCRFDLPWVGLSGEMILRLKVGLQN